MTSRLIAVTSTGQVSGAERVLLRTLAAAVDAGWDAACLCPPGPLAAQVRATGARHVATPDLTLGSGPRLLAALRMVLAWLRAARVLRSEASTADVVLANALLSLPAVRLAGLASVPAVWLAHDVVVARDRLLLYRWCRRALSLVVGVSEAVVAPLRPVSARSGIGPAVDVVHNGVPYPVAPAHEWVEGPAPEGREIVVGLNALLTPWKGQEVLLDAVPLLDARVRVEMLGGYLSKDDEYAAGLGRSIVERGLSARVRLLGHDEDPLARMRTWSIAVSASTDPEACPLAVLEAMSLGLPVVATDHGGSPEVLDGAGIVVAPRDASALAEAVNRLAGDPELRARNALLGLDRVARAHRLDHQTSALLAVLARTAGDYRPPLGGERRRPEPATAAAAGSST